MTDPIFVPATPDYPSGYACRCCGHVWETIYLDRIKNIKPTCTKCAAHNAGKPCPSRNQK